MATFNITTPVNIDNLTGKTGGDTYNINGGILNIDQDSRYGNTATTSATWAAVTISATLGGTVNVDARAVRIVPFRGGSGVVPAHGTVITKSGNTGTGKLIGVYSGLSGAPFAPANTMPATGFLKLKQFSGVFSNSGAFTGITANSNGQTVPGWIEIVGDRANTVTVSRLGTFKVRGDWFQIGITSGVNSTTYQIPTNGGLVWLPGVWVETGTNTGNYEFFPCAGSLTATSTNVATDARGKLCWISTAGVLRFQHDGTNSTGGFLPPSGRRIRVPNVFFYQAASGARTVNVIPNATLATRYEFATSGAGYIDIENASMGWWLNLVQPYAVILKNSSTFSQILIQECATPVVMQNVGVGQEAATAQFGLSLSLCFAGGVVNNSVFTSASLGTSGRYIESISDITGFSFSNTRSFSLVSRGNATTGCATITRARNTTWNRCSIGVGRHLLIGCDNITYNNTVYWDHPVTTTAVTNPMFIWDLATASSSRVTINGLSFLGTLMQPYSGLLNIGVAGCSSIRMRNMGTPASPLNLGGSKVNDRSWSRVTTTATVTSVAHGLKVNDIIYVWQCSDTTPIPLGAKTVASTPTADTFTFTATNSGGASGRLSYYATMTATPVVIAAAAAANDIKVQRVYTIHNRTNLITGDNSSKNIYLENFWNDPVLAPTNPFLNAFTKGLFASFSVAGQTSVYGSHYIDFATGLLPSSNVNQAWTRSSNTVTVSSNNHNLRTGERIFIVGRTNAAIPFAPRSVTVANNSTFTFVANNSGTASGTLSWHNMSGRLVLQMNEETTETSTVFDVTGSANGTPAFTSSGTIYMPNPTQEATWTMPYYTTGIDGFIAIQPVMAGGTISRYNMYYQIDKNDGSGFSSYKNLYLNKPGGGGSTGSTTVTMTNTSEVAVGDFVWGTNIAPYARVTNIVNTTTITVDRANLGTVSGVLIFSQLGSEANISATLGFRLKIKIRTITADTVGISSLTLFTKLSSAGLINGVYDLDPVTVSVTAKDAANSALISNARILMEADTGGSLPAHGSTSSNVVITRSGNTATAVHFTAHNLSSGKQVVIRGANQTQYNRIHTITVSNTTAYTFPVTGTPASPATGVIKATAIVLNGNTVSGVLSGTFAYSGTDQPVTGTARKGTTAPYYKPSLLSGTITSSGLSTTTFLVGDT